ncbi:MULTISPECIES: respiratory nitrate reductase subunit gamma [unclassified Streptomyces]|uniref:respiratory nitrate reductase subunit gamma n=1 Tax=unclassified Streptomyces TaxID=2593676 RepID=UPI00366165E3
MHPKGTARGGRTSGGPGPSGRPSRRAVPPPSVRGDRTNGAGAIPLGISATAAHDVFGGGYDCRGTVSDRFRGLFVLGARPEAIADAPPLFRLHAPSACLLFAAWPFTRLVRVRSAPVGHL